MSVMGHQRIATAAREGLDRVLAITDAHPGASLGDAYLGRTTTDVLAHLHAWHSLFEGWIEAQRSGETVAFPAEGFTWKELDALNEALYQAHAGRSYSSVRDALIESHDLLLALVAAAPESELVERSAYEWLGDEALGDVAHECLGAHYEWALGTLEAAGLTAQE
jgi:hypothetical protein